jgi:tRNA-dihydrouridine synthase
VPEIVATVIDHLDREIALKGTRTGINRMKRHFSGYLKGCPGVADLRKRVFAADDRDRIVDCFLSYAHANPGQRAA